MNKINIAIIEDVKEQAELLSKLIVQYLKENFLFGQLDIYESGEVFFEAIKNKTYQIVFLDISLGEEHGISIAKQIRSLDKAVSIVFATSSIEYAIESYDVSATYYVVKPVQKKYIWMAMEKACKTWVPSNNILKVLIDNVEKGILFSEIFFVDCQDRKVHIHMREREYIISNPAQEIFEILENEPTFLISNRWVGVNMDHVEEMQKDDFLLKNGKSVPIRVRNRKDVKSHYTEYKLKKI